MMLLPPQSSRKALRLGSASTISDISQIYGILISSWLTVEEEDEDKETNGAMDKEEESKPVSHPYEKWTPAFRAKLIAVATRLGAQKLQMNTIKWERLVMSLLWSLGYGLLITVGVGISVEGGRLSIMKN